MNRFTVFAIWLYTRSLSLYPSRFRAEFAEEMQMVFAQAVQEVDSPFRVAGLCLNELNDLPYSLVREHLRERRLTMNGAEHVATSKPFHFSVIVILTAATTYTLLVVLPFFALGLHLQPASLVASGAFDPSCYPLFDYRTTTGGLITLASFMTMLLAPISSAVFSGVLTIALLKGWRQIGERERLVGSVALLAGVSIIGFMFSPTGRLIMTWLLD